MEPLWSVIVDEHAVSRGSRPTVGRGLGIFPAAVLLAGLLLVGVAPVVSSVAAVSTISATAGAGTEGGSIRRSSRVMNDDERSKAIWSLPPSKSPLKRARLSETIPAMRSSMHCWLTRL